MKKENWRGRNKKFGERSKPSGSLGEGKGPSALFARQLFLFIFFFFFLLFYSVFAFAHTVVAQAVIFSRNVFFNDIPLKMWQVFEHSVSDNSPILLTSYTKGKFKVDTTNVVLVCTVGGD